jgi:hypothetical protein
MEDQKASQTIPAGAETIVAAEPIFDRRHASAPLRMVGWKLTEPLPLVCSTPHLGAHEAPHAGNSGRAQKETDQ